MTDLKANGRATGQALPPAEINLVCMSEITPRPIEWLWPGRLARRKLTLVTGEPETGETLLGLDAIARITTARSWPDEASGSAPLGECIVLSAEDAADDTLHPRLEAAGADLGRVYTVKSVIRCDQEGKAHLGEISLQYDLEQLGAKIDELGDVSLIFVDPLNAFFGEQVDTHKTAAVRSVLGRLQSFADRDGVAVLGIMHPPKTVAGGKAINAVTGSQACGRGACRRRPSRA
jgi:putative DNA primase/helicase